MTIHPDIDLTKKGEAYASLAEADGVFFLTLAKGDRLSLATTIERLIDMLDALEPDPDLEPYLSGSSGDDDREGADEELPVNHHCRNWNCTTEDDEPTLGAPENHPERDGRKRSKSGAQAAWYAVTLADGECEPTLGTSAILQQHWTEGYDAFDGEREDVSEDEGAQDDREPCTDYEPSMGWSETCGQGLRVNGEVYEADSNDDSFVPVLGFQGDGHAEGRDMLRKKRGIGRDPDQLFEFAPGVMLLGGNVHSPQRVIIV